MSDDAQFWLCVAAHSDDITCCDVYMRRGFTERDCLGSHIYKNMSVDQQLQARRLLYEAFERIQFQPLLPKWHPRRLWWVASEYVKHDAKWNPWRKYRGIDRILDVLIRAGRYEMSDAFRPCD